MARKGVWLLSPEGGAGRRDHPNYGNHQTRGLPALPARQAEHSVQRPRRRCVDQDPKEVEFEAALQLPHDRRFGDGRRAAPSPPIGNDEYGVDLWPAA